MKANEQKELLAEQQSNAIESTDSIAYRLKLQHQIDKAILTASDLDDITGLAIRHLKEYYKCHRVSLTYFNHSDLTYSIVVCESDTPSMILNNVILPMKDFRLTKEFYDGEILAIHNTSILDKKSELEQILLDEGIITYISIPLIVDGELIGGINLGHTIPGFFENIDLQMAKEISDSVSVAIAQDRLKQQICRQAERMAIIREIEHRIINQKSTANISSTAASKIREFLKCQQSAVGLFNFQAQYIELIADDSVISIGTQIGEKISLEYYHIADEIYNYEHILEIDLELKSHRTPIESMLYNSGIRSYISVPLVAYNELLGVINLGAERANAFTIESIETAKDIARSMAIAIYQAQLREQIISNNEELEQKVEQRTKELTDANCQLLENKKMMQHIADNVPGAVFRYSIYENLDYEISFISLGCVEIFGLSPNQMIGKGLEVLNIMPDDKDVFFNTLLASKAFLTQWAWEFRILLSDKETKWIRVLAQPVIDNKNTVTWTGTFTDITDLINYQEEIVRLNNELEDNVVQLQATNKELEAFSYSVSHDLRSPLRSMNGFSEVLVEEYADKLDDTARDYLSRIQSASNKMANLIDDLLKLSRLTRTDIQKHDIDLIPIANEIISELSKMSPDRKFETRFRSNILVNADTALIKILLNNLLSNAWKFSSKKEITEIEIDTEVIDNREYIYVRDHGAGFDCAYSHKIFGVFQRLHTEKEFEGTGVGLAIVQRIINKHGGEIFAKSQINKGSTFYFYF